MRYVSCGRMGEYLEPEATTAVEPPLEVRTFVMASLLGLPTQSELSRALPASHYATDGTFVFQPRGAI